VPAATRSVRKALASYVDSLVSAPEFGNARWGVLIVDPQAGDTLYAHDADKLFMPASNMKLVTGAVALSQLGADFRFSTTYSALGRIQDSTLFGDLAVYGTGDPTVSVAMRGDALAPLREVADSLRARGISSIAGNLIAAGDAFPDASYGFGWAWDDFPYPYSAGIDELFLNEGFGTVVIRSGSRAGDSTVTTMSPVAGFPPVRNEVVTALPRPPAPGVTQLRDSVRFGLDSATGGIVAVGWISPGDSAVHEFAYRDQRAAFFAGLAQALASEGITIVGDTGLTSTLTSNEADSLFTVVSPPLLEILPAMAKPSQNQIAEILYKTLGRIVAGAGTSDSARRVVERQLTVWGIDSAGFAIRDGSGLSRHDYLSPRTVVRILDVMRRSEQFEAFYSALPIAGVDGTIENRMKGTAAQGNLRGKTGTLDKARSLSGYVHTADGRLLLFSALCNNYTVPLARVTHVQDLIGEYLASIRLDSRRN
jgi:D-alanyl-D-alanine carboxypeptidase/D-alanyl-D-alanine-endopeptidase (penicillin-binding protein 4)